ncbi:hypothetical protein [Bradyrhizobium sp. SSUT77]|uniref:hypothetical protein n=1 Tax=Bradyrhizobium sp. SSUT77 TaxID=3040603 RepID=UPI00244CA4BF|nr:hypothetical protein [Bradyrhizobium sp. SSUT77]MDH2341716.1 hypothetical protein [Bradyrhizobium sp. SSUT77]
MVLARARIDQPIGHGARDLRDCSQPLCRSLLNNGSWPETNAAQVTDYGPDMIFQGAFDEMQRADRKVDPKALAASLGFTAAPIRTLETAARSMFTSWTIQPPRSDSTITCIR